MERRPHESKVTAIAFGEGGLYATASQDGTAVVQRLDAARALATLRGHEAAVTCACFVPPAGRIATGSSDHSVRLWSIFGSREIKRFELDDSIVSVTATADGRHLAALSRSGTLAIWDVDSGTESARLPDATREASGRSVGFSPAGDFVIVEHRDRAWSGWSLGPNGLTAAAPLSFESHLPRYTLIHDPKLPEMLLALTASGKVVTAYPTSLECVASSSDGTLFAGWNDGALEVLRAQGPITPQQGAGCVPPGARTRDR